MKSLKSLILCGALFTALPSVILAQTANSYQPTARPYGLSLAGVTDQVGSDAAAASFQTNDLAGIEHLVNTQLGETKYMSNSNLHAVDTTKLTLATDYTARVYFVGEGAGYQNTLGFNTVAPGAAFPTTGLDSSAKIIFPNASSSISAMSSNTTPRRSASEPLLPGDFVDLGRFAAGSTLDFFLISNGNQGGTNVMTDEAARNPDHLNHMVAFAAPNSPYLILAFEDLFGGGDRDYNDVVIALDIGVANVQKLISAPEPATWGILAAFLGLAWWSKRRQSGAGTMAAA